MKLLLDVGNSRVKAALVDGDELIHESFSDDILAQFDITEVVLASVRNNDKLSDIVAMAATAGVPLTQVQVQPEAFGVSCGYENYQTLGIDRWLAVLGATDLYPGENIIVIDAGTATTVDFVTADKHHLGGWIIPGLTLMADSIATLADKVFDDPDTEFDYGVGTTTPQALKYGCLAAQCGIVYQAIDYFDCRTRVVLTGGNGQRLFELLDQSGDPFITELQPLLVFKGLSLY